MSNIIKKAVEWALAIANDNSHGYDQSKRWGGDYDCSALVISAYEQAGVPVKKKGATYTGNIKKVFLSNGFMDVTSKVTLSSGAGLEYGDVLLKEGSHTGISLGNGTLVHASINENGKTTGGKAGDQTGKEICVRKYYNKPWDCVLRYKDSSTVASSSSGSSTSSSKTHTVVSGDTLSEIAEKNKTTVAAIVAANKVKYPKITASYIVVGWKLKV